MLKQPECTHSAKGATQGAQQRTWSSRSLAGRWRHNFFYLLLRVAGVKVAKVPLFFVVLFYCLHPAIAARSRPYLQRCLGEGGPAKNFCRVFRLYWNFACVLLERAAKGILHNSQVTPLPGCMEMIEQLLVKGKGLILLSAHVGAWQTALSGLEFGVKVNIVQLRDNQDIDRHVFEHNAKMSSQFHIINSSGPFGGWVEMRAALQRGEIVCLMGDRLMPGETLMVETSFLGYPAMFPGSAYVLASLSQAPLAVVFSRRSGECAVECACVESFMVPPQVRKKENDVRPYAAAFAQALEKYVAREPYQFFNFYNFWTH